MESKRNLSEISHLFLTEVRDRMPGSASRPARVPPGKSADPSVDMTPEEFAASMNEDAIPEQDARPIPTEGRPSSGDGPTLSGERAVAPQPLPAASPRVSVVLASHLVEQPAERVRQYARHLAATAGRVGVIEVDNAEFAITCFEAHGGEAAVPGLVEELDGRRMSETLAELCFDVERWLLYLPNPRTAESREMFRAAPHWLLLTTADHDGVVAAYRSLKGMADLGKRQMSLVVLDARDEAQAEAVYNKLDAVSRQFLGCPMNSEPAVRPVQDITEHLLLRCRATHDKAQMTAAPQWQIVGDFLAAGSAPVELASAMPAQPISEPVHPQHTVSAPVAPVSYPMPETPTFTAPAAVNAAPAIPIMPRLASASGEEVIDLPTDTTDAGILDAIVRQGGADGKWIQCPLRAPMCPAAVLAVGRDQRLILLAVAGRGLTALRSIGLALRWVTENRDLIRMAMPQLAIDAAASPQVQLIVDHADLSADVLQPLLQSEIVTVQAYRKLKWGQKSGLLLEAA